jgi:pilus assembly protein Flp/PilA
MDYFDLRGFTDFAFTDLHGIKLQWLYVKLGDIGATKECSMRDLISRFVKDESGATAIEYALIAAGISITIVAIVQAIGGKLVTTFTSVENGI